MKGVRFYEERRYRGHETREESKGTVVAVFHEQRHRLSKWTGVPLYQGVHRVSGNDDCQRATPNEPVCEGEVSKLYLDSECRRVNEARARRIHPKLFEHLEGSEKHEGV